jgi:transposase
MKGTVMAVAITRSDISAAKLRKAAARMQDTKAARRMLAIALVLEDWSREAAAQACAMDRQTLRDWVHRYNELGLDGTGRDGDRISGLCAVR